MDNLDKVRARQKVKSEKIEKKRTTVSSKRSSSAERGTESSASATKRASTRSGASSRAAAGTNPADGGGVRKTSVPSQRRKKKKSKWVWLSITIKLILLIAIATSIAVGVWLFSITDFSFGDDLSTMNLNISSKVYYTNSEGQNVEYEQFNASQNCVWVPISKMPENMKNAIVAIEDQRFYKHRGFDIKRTAGAAMNYILKGDSSYGGSTITQQLVKNITDDKSRDASRKLREITRSIVLETKLSKQQILEMYLNTIYLSQGANGVEAAANIYFSKSVSDLSLVECACIAGITQLPSKFDPILNPENNKEKRNLVLQKMLELKFISKAEYDEAVNTELQLNVGNVQDNEIQSYFLDHLFEEIQADLVEKGYTEQFAANMIYNGGLKIYATVDPEIQNRMETYFENSANFPSFSGEQQPQAAMIITDPHTGEIKGLVGGRGEKNLNRGLNRATQTKRQPGSSIKPIAVYGPAIDLGIITPSTVVDDSHLKIETSSGPWIPQNSNRSFRGYVSVKTAVTWSYNIPAVRVLEALTVNKSFDYMKNRLHVNSLSDSDKALSPLSLGGLTQGVTLLEMNGAYATFANDGKYVEPHAYTKIYDVEGKLLMEKQPVENQAFSPATAFQMNQLLKSVVTEGTGSGAQLSNMDTCGKTGTTDKSKDRWFIGYSPYYVASVWFGYDNPKAISASGNPALNIWEDIMQEIHKPLESKYFEAPDGVEEKTVCSRTGYAPSQDCSRVTQYADVGRASKKCPGNHKYIGTRPYKAFELPEEEGEEGEEGEETPENEEQTNPEGTVSDPAVPGQNPPAAPTPELLPTTDTPAPPAQPITTPVDGVVY